MTKSLQELCEFMLPVIRETGVFIMGHLYKHDSTIFNIKGRNNIVSLVDREAELQLVAAAKTILPGSTFLTEEGTISDSKGEWKWVIDPLDGTSNFYYKIPLFSVSVGLMRNDEIVMGIVYDVTNDDMYYAWKDGGAYLNGSPIKASSIVNRKEAFIATGIPNDDYPQIEQYLKALQHLINTTRGIRRLGSAALELAYVSAGKFDAFFEHGLSPWDVAAGIILIKEAGGRVTDFFGEDDCYQGKNILASGSGIHDSLLEVTSKYFHSFRADC